MLKTYIRRPRPVEAIKLRAWLARKSIEFLKEKAIISDYRESAGGFEVIHNNEPIMCRFNDWIIVDQNGSLFVFEDSAFRSSYWLSEDDI